MLLHIINARIRFFYFVSMLLQCQKHFLRSGFSENGYCQFIDWNCIYMFPITFVKTCIPDHLIKIINKSMHLPGFFYPFCKIVSSNLSIPYFVALEIIADKIVFPTACICIFNPCASFALAYCSIRKHSLYAG